MIATGQITRNQIPLNAELIATFLKLWSHLEQARKADIGLPFYHLTSDAKGSQGHQFWHYRMKPGFDQLLTGKVKIRTPSTIRDTVEYVYLDDELWELLQNPQDRSTLTHVLISEWFSSRSSEIESLLQVNVFVELQEQLRSLGGKVYSEEELKDDETKILRDATFRRVIILVYEYRCAFCGLQIINSLGQNIVDSAHIKPFSQFYDDCIDNGLSLCKNHHWAFDRGWFSINDDYSIIVCEDLQERSPNRRAMREFGGDHLYLPNNQQYYPRLDALQWHP